VRHKSYLLQITKLHNIVQLIVELNMPKRTKKSQVQNALKGQWIASTATYYLLIINLWRPLKLTCLTIFSTVTIHAPES